MFVTNEHFYNVDSFRTLHLARFEKTVLVRP